MKQTILIFSAIAASMLILLQLRRISIYSGSNQEFWSVVFACLFIVIGIVLTRYIFRAAPSPNEMMSPIREAEIMERLKKTGITQREYEVLRLVEQGYSNQEISSKLFISESTVKTHVSNVLVKLDAKRRTQAVQKAKELRIL